MIQIIFKIFVVYYVQVTLPYIKGKTLEEKKMGIKRKERKRYGVKREERKKDQRVVSRAPSLSQALLAAHLSFQPSVVSVTEHGI